MNQITNRLLQIVMLKIQSALGKYDDLNLMSFD